VLSGLAREFAEEPTYLASLSPERGERQQMLESLGALYARGATVDWAGVHRGRGGRKVSLPTYPFERTRHWMEGERAGQPRRSPRPGANGHPLLGQRVASAGDARFESEIGADRPAYLGEHRVYGLALLPAAGFVELALAAARELVGDGPCEVRDLTFERALVLPDGEQRRCQVVLTARADQPGHDVQVHSRAADEMDPAAPWLLHARGAIVPGEPSIQPPPDGDAAAVDRVDLAPFYRALGDRGMAYGASFRGLTELWRGRQGDGTAAARAELPASAAEGGRLDGHRVHPALLDACFHALGGALLSRFALGNAIRMAFLPVAIRRVAFVRPPGARIRCRARVELDPGGLEYTGDVWLLDDDDHVVLAVEGMRMQGVERGQLRAASLRGGAPPDARQRLLDAAPADRWSIMVQVLVDLVSEIVGIGAAEVDESLMYFELGMSSLASVELQYRLQRALQCRLGADLAVDYQTTASLARLLLVQVVGPDGFVDPEQAERR
jgi:acyl transferase domain-containing protein